ncbi:MAG: 16S rRNA (guanine(527)-N(7))-methyltransferase RsmG [Mogibacterium sp.]|nr:16S rRNA (guanine(527)-N(7))-methyltransferase RsmG [Mogibacterium sp.]
MANKEDTLNLIQELTSRYGEAATEKLVSYVDKVLERNEHINLTAVRDRDEAMQKHLADSLAAAELPEFLSAERIIDIGTGAGFPGALLAIAFPEKTFVLMDSTLKRLKVIDEFAADLGISNLMTIHGRAEELARKEEFKESFDVCVSRAVASLDKLSGWCLPYVKSGGYFIPYKGENYQTELKDAQKQLKKYKGSFIRAVNISGESSDISGHVLMVIRKK